MERTCKVYRTGNPRSFPYSGCSSGYFLQPSRPRAIRFPRDLAPWSYSLHVLSAEELVLVVLGCYLSTILSRLRNYRWLERLRNSLLARCTKNKPSRWLKFILGVEVARFKFRIPFANLQSGLLSAWHLTYFTLC